MEEERAVCDACGSHDRADVGRGEAGSLELGDRRSHQPFARLQAFGLAR